MEWWQALVLGIVEGVTEFLPVSSTGHLILAERALGLPQNEAIDAYTICIQAGAIVAVLALYPQRIASAANGAIGRDPAGRRLLINLVVGFLPAGILGFALHHAIEQVLFGLWPVVGAWMVGGFAILAFERWKRDHPRGPGLALDQLDARGAALIGLAQCLALWPGTSRSLATLIAGMLVGLSVPAAVEFTFLLGVVTLGAATAFAGLKHGPEMVHEFGPVPIVLGFMTAALAAAAAVKGFVGWLGSHGLELFAAWRIVLALIVAALLVIGALKP
jgi:undecaprenyl-diphosphatase